VPTVVPVSPVPDPLDLTPDQRRAELTRVLAAAVLRLHDRAALAAPAAPIPAPENPQNSVRDGLEVGADLRLSGPTG